MCVAASNESEGEPLEPTLKARISPSLKIYKTPSTPISWEERKQEANMRRSGESSGLLVHAVSFIRRHYI